MITILPSLGSEVAVVKSTVCLVDVEMSEFQGIVVTLVKSAAKDVEKQENKNITVMKRNILNLANNIPMLCPFIVYVYMNTVLI